MISNVDLSCRIYFPWLARRTDRKLSIGRPPKHKKVEPASLSAMWRNTFLAGLSPFSLLPKWTCPENPRLVRSICHAGY